MKQSYAFNLEKKRFLAISFHGRLSGGGNAFIEQTMQWCHKQGMQCAWIYFATFDNKPFEEFNCTQTKYGYLLQIPHGFSQTVLEQWIDILRPDIVHHQGHKRVEIMKVLDKFNIPAVCGIHFWNGIIDLNAATYNVDVQKHIDLHKPSPEFNLVNQHRNLTWYVCSEFVRNIIKTVCKVDIPKVICPASSYEHTKCDYNDVQNALCVAQINIHKLKGGLIFHHLIKNLPDIPFIGVQSEHHSEELDKQIRNSVNEHKLPVKILTFTLDIKNDVYKNSKILLVPSLVDETFCRTVNEALANGIVIVTTGKGNILDLVGEAAIIVNEDNLDEWVSIVKQLHSNVTLWTEYSQRSLRQYKKCSEKVHEEKFVDLVQSVMDKSKLRNLMFFCPFTSQGLGIQVRNYVLFLRKAYNVFIFSFKPYNAAKAIDLQKDPEEWNIPNVTIFYSNFERENVPDSELIDFVHTHNIGKFIIPETCWKRVFQINELMHKLHVKTLAIPNLEIIRRDELHKHIAFNKILCNNDITLRTLKDLAFENVNFLGYVEHKNCSDQNSTSISQIDRSLNVLDLNSCEPKKIRLLCLGGFNAISRKKADKIAQAVVQSDLKDKIHLTITLQNHILYDLKKLEQFRSEENITIIEDNLTNSQINDLYKSSDICFQVSGQEGLGLSFYQSLSQNVPVISLKTNPHQEIIKHEKNGWLLDCFHSPMLDNNSGLIQRADFSVDDLIILLQHLSNNRHEIEKMKSNIMIANAKHELRQKVFMSNFLKLLDF